jgi:hypothetical protein
MAAYGTQALQGAIADNVLRVCDQPRGQQGRGAVWRSCAPQRRAARGAFPGADAHTRCYGQLRGFSLHGQSHAWLMPRREEADSQSLRS